MVEKDVPLGNGVYVIDASILCKEHPEKHMKPMTHTKFRRQLEWKLNQNFQSSAGVKRGHPSTSDQEMDGQL